MRDIGGREVSHNRTGRQEAHGDVIHTTRVISRIIPFKHDTLGGRRHAVERVGGCFAIREIRHGRNGSEGAHIHITIGDVAHGKGAHIVAFHLSPEADLQFIQRIGEFGQHNIAGTFAIEKQRVCAVFRVVVVVTAVGNVRGHRAGGVTIPTSRDDTICVAGRARVTLKILREGSR